MPAPFSPWKYRRTGCSRASADGSGMSRLRHTRACFPPHRGGRSGSAAPVGVAAANSDAGVDWKTGHAVRPAARVEDERVLQVVSRQRPDSAASDNSLSSRHAAPDAAQFAFTHGWRASPPRHSGGGCQVQVGDHFGMRRGESLGPAPEKFQRRRHLSSGNEPGK
jgi:hypothetical protein